MKTIYLCGPINGCTDEECNDWRRLVQTIAPWNEYINPMRRDYRGVEGDNDADIVEFDKVDVTNSDVVLVSYDKPSVGTSMEVLYGWERGKLIVVVHQEGAVLSPWLTYHSHRRFTSYYDALDWIQTQ
jgi:hypothetical protein